MNPYAARAGAVSRSSGRTRSKYSASAATDAGTSPSGMPISRAAVTCSAT